MVKAAVDAVTSQVEPKLLAIDQALLRLTTLVQEALGSKNIPQPLSPPPVSSIVSPHSLNPLPPHQLGQHPSFGRPASPELEYYTSSVSTSNPQSQSHTRSEDAPSVSAHQEPADPPQAGQSLICILITLVFIYTSKLHHLPTAQQKSFLPVCQATSLFLTPVSIVVTFNITS